MTVIMKMKMKKLNSKEEYESEDEIAFRVNYSPDTSLYISINGHWISRPHTSKNICDFFEYVHTNPDRIITKVEIEKNLQIKLNKGVDDILRDLGFRGVLAKIFFKKMTNDSVYFTNPVYVSDLKKLGIDLWDVYKLIYTPKRKGAITPTN